MSDAARRLAWRTFMRERTPDAALRWAEIEARSLGERDPEGVLASPLEHHHRLLDYISAGAYRRALRGLERLNGAAVSLGDLADADPEQLATVGCGLITRMTIALALEQLGVFRDAWVEHLMRVGITHPRDLDRLRRMAASWKRSRTRELDAADGIVT